jgi:hypothetical protein
MKKNSEGQVELEFLRCVTTENALRAANSEASSAWKGKLSSASIDA